MKTTSAVEAREKSQGHIDFIGRFEYYMREINGSNELFRADYNRPVMIDGYRCGRWEAPERMVEQHINMIWHMEKDIR